MCVTKMRTNEALGVIGYGCFSHSKRNVITSGANDNKLHQHTLFQETAMWQEWTRADIYMAMVVHLYHNQGREYCNGENTVLLLIQQLNLNYRLEQKRNSVPTDFITVVVYLRLPIITI